MNYRFSFPSEFLRFLKICDSQDELVLDEIEQHGLKLDEVIDSSSELLNDALFVNESIARRVLGTNYVRICSSLRKFTDLLGLLQLESGRIADLGGGAGLASMWAAIKFPNLEFHVLDRAENSLKIGKMWANDLDLNNIIYNRMSFQEIPEKAQLPSFKLVLLDYVISPIADEDDPEGEKIIERMEPAFRAIASLLDVGAYSYVRFGAYDEIGIRSLVQSAANSGLAVCHNETMSERTGTTVGFERVQIPPNFDADLESNNLLEEFYRNQSWFSNCGDIE